MTNRTYNTWLKIAGFQSKLISKNNNVLEGAKVVWLPLGSYQTLLEVSSKSKMT